jgi:hypothetical protein
MNAFPQAGKKARVFASNHYRIRGACSESAGQEHQ